MGLKAAWILALFWVLVLTSTDVVDAQEAIFLIRHAEQSAASEDPPLTDAGQRRAERLAMVLKDVGIHVIYATDTKRTRQTAEVVATALKIETRSMPQRDVEGLVGRLRTEHAQHRVLIVSHSHIIPRLLKALGYPLEISIGRDEYDNLFVITSKGESRPLVLRLRF